MNAEPAAARWHRRWALLGLHARAVYIQGGSAASIHNPVPVAAGANPLSVGGLLAPSNA